MTGALTGSDVIERISVALPVPAEFVAMTVMVAEPIVAGVPEISPVVAFTLKPVGRPVASNKVGLLAAAIW